MAGASRTTIKNTRFRSREPDSWSAHATPSLSTNARCRSHGFTIVELLIVVVVIAILAAITIVAYNGITRKAQATAYVAAADTVEKQVRIMMETSPPAGPVATCLGDASDFPARDGFAKDECIYVEQNGQHTSIGYNFSEPSMTAIRTAYPSILTPRNLAPADTADYYGSKYHGRGIYVVAMQSFIQIWWVSPDASACGRGDVGSAQSRAQLIQLYEPLVPILQRAHDGAISLSQAQTELEAIVGPLGEPLTMTIVDPLLATYSGLVSNPAGLCYRSIK